MSIQSRLELLKIFQLQVRKYVFYDKNFYLNGIFVKFSLYTRPYEWHKTREQTKVP